MEDFIRDLENKVKWIIVFLYGLFILIIITVLIDVAFHSQTWGMMKEIMPAVRVDTIVKFDTISLKVPVQKFVTLTVYNPVESQCDDTPLITANGTIIDLEKLRNSELRYCAVSRDLLEEIPYGSIIYIEGHGEYKVVDTMNKRFTDSVDILQDESEPIFKKNNIKILKVN